MKKRSRPDSDYKLEEPSHMKSSAIDAWLQHWLQIQKKGKRPLVLKASSDKASELDGKKDPKVADRQSSKKSKAGYIEPDDETNNINDGASDAPGTNGSRGTDNLLVPKSPRIVSPTPAMRRIFLTSLSDDVHYKKLLLLLLAAKVSNTISVATLTDKRIGR
jgi:hypothetical protein